MYTDKLPKTSEHRFETMATLPNICSKYTKSDRSVDLAKLSQRNPNYMIKETAFGNNLATADQGFKKNIKGQVSFDKMKAREPLDKASEYAANIYTYADSVDRHFKSGHKPLFKGITSMNK